jgi:hypothetical protein
MPKANLAISQFAIALSRALSLTIEAICYVDDMSAESFVEEVVASFFSISADDPFSKDALKSSEAILLKVKKLVLTLSAFHPVSLEEGSKGSVWSSEDAYIRAKGTSEAITEMYPIFLSKLDEIVQGHGLVNATSYRPLRIVISAYKKEVYDMVNSLNLLIRTYNISIKPMPAMRDKDIPMIIIPPKAI